MTIHGDEVVIAALTGDAMAAWHAARAASAEHYPVLVHDAAWVTEPDYRPSDPPADLIARAASVDLEAWLAREMTRDEELLGTGLEGYYLDSYNAMSYGTQQTLVILPRPEPWAAFAYLDAYAMLGDGTELAVATARAWHDRYGAVPTVVGMASGFLVDRRPADVHAAERLAAEHVAIAGLSARTTLRAYARALMHLDQWCLYNRP
ncbi:DUF4253 domain-containing protein [Actinoplanes sp. NPDC049548]|uniref:DUF4253 domain-containing protein n=1 Tax=Actinoplanes sp. NPDC049548 TaxID=3155152 RepID=UPI0034139D9D